MDIYHDYPPSEREEFVEQFWARRDPNPKTFINEFREEYYRRIRTANELFKGGIAGWLQDRGRIFILFGPPDEREAYAMGMNPNVKPTESWVYYSFFTTSHAAVIYFIDIDHTGNYKIATDFYQIDPTYIAQVSSRNIAYAHNINKLESIARQAYLKEPIFNFKWNFKKDEKKENKKELQVNIEIPYERIMFSQNEDQFVAEMELFIEIRDTNQELIWDYYNKHSISFPYSEFDSKKNSLCFFNIPVTQGLQKGRYSVYIQLTNLSGNQDVKKLLDLKM